jgi:adenylylsulfate kinase
MEKGFVLWFTGLPSSGKSILARMAEERLLEMGLKVEVLDGDEVRKNLSKGLGFSKEDRDTNIRRVGYVCKLLSRNGIGAIACCISPYREIRNEVRKDVGNFVEVYVKCPIDVLKERDVKGLYKKALKGEIKGFTGVDDPYEEPEKPEVIVETDKESPEQSCNKIIKTLELLGYIPKVQNYEYSEEEEKVVKNRLKDLGYI